MARFHDGSYAPTLVDQPSEGVERRVGLGGSEGPRTPKFTQSKLLVRKFVQMRSYFVSDVRFAVKIATTLICALLRGEVSLDLSAGLRYRGLP